MTAKEKVLRYYPNAVSVPRNEPYIGWVIYIPELGEVARCVINRENWAWSEAWRVLKNKKKGSI